MTITSDPKINEPDESAAADERWRVGRGLSLLPYGPNEVFVRHGSRSQMSKVVRDPERRMVLWPLLLSILDDAKSLDSVLAELTDSDGPHGDALDSESLDQLVNELANSGVVEVETELPPFHVTLLGGGLVAENLAGLIDDLDVDIIDLDTIDLDDIGALVAELTHETSLLVVANDRLRPAADLAVNEAAMATGHAVLRLTLDGDECVIGPLVVPGETGCLSCLDVQDEASRQFLHDFISYKQHAANAGLLVSSPPSPMTKIGASIVGAIGAAAIRDALRQRWGFLCERVVRIDLGRWDVATDRVIALPRCPSCMRARVDPRHTFL